MLSEHEAHAAARAQSNAPAHDLARIAILALAVAVAAGAYAYFAIPSNETRRDFHQTWFAAQALLDGASPYQLIGPDGPYRWRWPFYYPLPAALIVMPLAPLSGRVAFAVWGAFGGGTLAFALLRYRETGSLWILCSGAMVRSVAMGQWAPLLTAAYLLPALQFTYLGKPSIGAGLWLTRPSHVSRVGIGVGIMVVGVSFALQPQWVGEWLQAIRQAPHITAPITRTVAGAFLIPLVLYRWRDPSARLLFALACVPQTPAVYETLPLLLIGRRWQEYLGLSVLTTVAEVTVTGLTLGQGLDARFAAAGPIIVDLVYLPCVALVLLRGEQPAASRCGSSNTGSDVPRPNSDG